MPYCVTGLEMVEESERSMLLNNIEQSNSEQYSCEAFNYYERFWNVTQLILKEFNVIGYSVMYSGRLMLPTFSIKPCMHACLHACIHLSMHPYIHPCLHPSIHIILYSRYPHQLPLYSPNKSFITEPNSIIHVP